jgi:hypothetical protein
MEQSIRDFKSCREIGDASPVATDALLETCCAQSNRYETPIEEANNLKLNLFMPMLPQMLPQDCRRQIR